MRHQSATGTKDLQEAEERAPHPRPPKSDELYAEAPRTRRPISAGCAAGALVLGMLVVLAAALGVTADVTFERNVQQLQTSGSGYNTGVAPHLPLLRRGFELAVQGGSLGDEELAAALAPGLDAWYGPDGYRLRDLPRDGEMIDESIVVLGVWDDELRWTPLSARTRMSITLLVADAGIPFPWPGNALSEKHRELPIIESASASSNHLLSQLSLDGQLWGWTSPEGHRAELRAFLADLLLSRLVAFEHGNGPVGATLPEPEASWPLQALTDDPDLTRMACGGDELGASVVYDEGWRLLVELPYDESATCELETGLRNVTDEDLDILSLGREEIYMLAPLHRQRCSVDDGASWRPCDDLRLAPDETLLLRQSLRSDHCEYTTTAGFSTTKLQALDLRYRLGRDEKETQIPLHMEINVSSPAHDACPGRFPRAETRQAIAEALNEGHGIDRPPSPPLRPEDLRFDDILWNETRRAEGRSDWNRRIGSVLASFDAVARDRVCFGIAGYERESLQTGMAFEPTPPTGEEPEHGTLIAARCVARKEIARLGAALLWATWPEEEPSYEGVFVGWSQQPAYRFVRLLSPFSDGGLERRIESSGVFAFEFGSNEVFEEGAETREFHFLRLDRETIFELVEPASELASIEDGADE